jgi:gas vesicle protein
MKQTLNIIAGFVSGGLVAAVVTLLVAPQSGVQTRHQIKKYALDAKSEAATALESARSQMMSSVEDVEIKARRLAEDIRREAKRRSSKVVSAWH